MKEGIRVGGRILNNIRYADDTTLMAESDSDLKNLLRRVIDESKKAGLTLNLKKTKIMSTADLSEFCIDGEKVEIVDKFVFLGSQLNRDNDCSQEIRRRLTLGRSAMDKLSTVWRDKSITTDTKVRLVNTLVFCIATYSCETWTIKMDDRKRINAFELWCWRRLLRIPWTVRRTNQSVLNAVKNPIPLETKMTRAKLQYYGHCIRKDGSLEKDLLLGLTQGGRRRGRPRRRWIDSISEDSHLDLAGTNALCRDRQSWRKHIHAVTMGRL